MVAMCGGHQRLWCCRQDGKELASRKPRHSQAVAQRLAELRGRWAGLCRAAEEKGQRLFQANRAELYARSCGELESLLGRAEEELRATEQAKDLTATNLLLKRLTVGGGTARRMPQGVEGWWELTHRVVLSPHLGCRVLGYVTKQGWLVAWGVAGTWLYSTSGVGLLR